MSRISNINPKCSLLDGDSLLIPHSKPGEEPGYGQGTEEEEEEEEEYQWKKEEMEALLCGCAISAGHREEMRVGLWEAARTSAFPLIALSRSQPPVELVDLPSFHPSVRGRTLEFDAHFVQIQEELAVSATHANSNSRVRSFTIKILGQLDPEGTLTEVDETNFGNLPTHLLRISSPPDFWEGYITSQLCKRLADQQQPAALRALFPSSCALYIYPSHGFFLSTFTSEYSLKATFDRSASEEAIESTFLELLAVFRTVEMLRLVEALHGANIIHGALSASAFLLPFRPEGLVVANLPEWKGALSGGWELIAMSLSNFASATDAAIVSPEEADFSLDYRGILNIAGRLFPDPRSLSAWVRPLCDLLAATLSLSPDIQLTGAHSARILSELRAKLTTGLLPHASRLPGLLSHECMLMDLSRVAPLLDQPSFTTSFAV